MTNTTTIKVGQMPGRINEYAVAPTATFAEVIALAGLTSEGYEVKADGVTVTDLNTQVGSTQLVLLAKQVKGNAVVKVGVMPGRINEFFVADGATVKEILEVASVSSEGYEVKVDGNTVTDFSTVAGTAGLILLTKQVKGNSTVKIGVMPGRINEFALEPTTSISDALAVAGVSAEGYEVKADGNTVTDLSKPIGTTQLILLTKQVKGNK